MDFDVQHSKDTFISDALKADFKKKFCSICTHTSNIILLKNNNNKNLTERLQDFLCTLDPVWWYFLHHLGTEGLPNASEADGTAGINAMTAL